MDFWDEAFSCEIFDLQHKTIFPSSENPSVTPADLIPKSTMVGVAIKCGGLWFANGKFGCTWKLVQAVVKPRTSFKGRCLINLSSEDTNRLSAQNDNDDDDDTGGVVLADDSDEEETEVAAPEPVVEQVKTVKKKVVRRKKATDS